MARDPFADPAPLVRQVYAYVAYRIGHGADAEDVTSDVFERAIRYRESYDPRRGAPVVWLLGIARRRIAGRRPPAEAPEAHETPAPEELEEEAVRRLSIAEAMRALPERDAELIALRYGADLTARQIGEIVGLRTNAVEVALHRALGRMRATLAGAPPPQPEDEHALRSVRI